MSPSDQRKIGTSSKRDLSFKLSIIRALSTHTYDTSTESGSGAESARHRVSRRQEHIREESHGAGAALRPVSRASFTLLGTPKRPAAAGRDANVGRPSTHDADLAANAPVAGVSERSWPCSPALLGRPQPAAGVIASCCAARRASATRAADAHTAAGRQGRPSRSWS